jgi:hypothetical protein
MISNAVLPFTDMATRRVTALGNDIGVSTDDTFHRLVVTFDGRNIHVGCTSISPRAWEILSKKVNEVCNG